jgi:hypothetical protein
MTSASGVARGALKAPPGRPAPPPADLEMPRETPG